MVAKLEIEYDMVEDLEDILKGLRNREARIKRTVLNNDRRIAITSLADAIAQHILTAHGKLV